ncbi:MAG TPA: hypothetical protein VGE19_07160 [Pseudoxanthomonas sp.]
MASETFGLDIARFVEKAKAAPEQVVRKVGLDLASRVVLRSPVDTGRFRANWNVAFGRVDTLTTPSTDKTGGKTLERVRVQINGWTPGQDIYLTNSLPYAIPLEYGWSKKQAPQGMVRITVAEFQTFVNAAVAELPK